MLPADTSPSKNEATATHRNPPTGATEDPILQSTMDPAVTDFRIYSPSDPPYEEITVESSLADHHHSPVIEQTTRTPLQPKDTHATPAAKRTSRSPDLDKAATELRKARLAFCHYRTNDTEKTAIAGINQLMGAVNAANDNLAELKSIMATLVTDVRLSRGATTQLGDELRAFTRSAPAPHTTAIDPHSRKRQREGPAKTHTHTCILCAAPHQTEQCTIYTTPHERRAEMARQGRCMTCGNAHHGKCRHAARRCHRCPPQAADPYHLHCLCPFGQGQENGQHHTQPLEPVRAQPHTASEDQLHRLVTELVQKQLSRLQGQGQPPAPAQSHMPPHRYPQ